jgi:U3 small nucleolar RNA-associated protein 23
MLYLKNSVMILEPPSAATHAKIAQMQQSKMMPTMLEKTALKPRPSANQNSNNTSTTQAPKKKKRRGPKGPNPLSCKKKKTAKPSISSSASIDAAATSADSGK